LTHSQLLRELRSEGTDVSTDGEIDAFTLNGVEVHAVIEPSRLCSYLAEQIRAFEPEWTLASSEDRSQSLLEAALKSQPSRVIYLAHTPQMFPFGPAGLYPGKRRTGLVGQAAAIVAISRFVADYIKSWSGLDAFVHHPPHYGSGPFPHLGRIDNDYVLLMNACAVKGLSILLALARALPRVRFAALPGWGTTQAELAALRGMPNVRLLNNAANLDDILCRTRALLMPSLWTEGFGMAVIDAMLRGIPVLAADHGGLTEAKLGSDYLLPVRPIERFEDRLDENLLPVPIVPKQDIDPWKNALTDLISDRGLYARQSAAARDAALNFARALTVEPFENFLHRLGTEAKPGKSRFPARSDSNSQASARDDDNPMPETLANLTPEQQALLMLRLRKKAADRAKTEIKIPALKAVSRDRSLPLSFAQQRLWLLDQLEPNSAVYNIPKVLRLKGTLDVRALEQSLNEIVRRHESLRTTFVVVNGEPALAIASSQNVAVPVIDLQSVPANEREGRARQLTTDEAGRPFDLARGPLMRATLLRLGPEHHVLALNVHHIVSDGWSMGVLARELTLLYHAFCRGAPSPLPELAIQYADFAVWQREWLTGEVLESQLAYWKRQLENLAPLELPTDRPRPARQTFRGQAVTTSLGPALTTVLKILSQREGVTLYMALLAAFKVLVHRYTGQPDIVVGSPIANRNRAEIEGLIGFFINTLVLRTKFSGDCTFRELLGRLRQTALEAYAHQDVPFERLLEELRPPRDLSRTPLFQVFFNMSDGEDVSVELSGLEVEPVAAAASVPSKFDLTVYAKQKDGSLQFHFVYNADLFSHDRIAEMLAQYELLLTQIVSDPDRKISSFSLVTPRAEKLLAHPAKLLDATWVGAVHSRLCYHAARTPQHPAVKDLRDTWTYRELHLRSNQLAQSLLDNGIGRGDCVAVYGHRSASLAWAVFGILKAGAVFLLLDPAYPTTRLIQYMRLAKVKGFVRLESSESVTSGLETFINTAIEHRVTLPRLHDLGSKNPFQSYSTDDPQVAVGPDDPAYVSFTSGSTGEAKGVVGRHGSLSHFLPWQEKTWRLTSADRFTMFSGLAHDPLQRDLFTPLWLGATLCIPDSKIIGTSQLAGWMAEEEVTFTHLTPAFAELLTESAAPDCHIPSLRYAFFIGDKLTRRDVGRLRRLAPRVRCIGSYGTTETQRAVGFYPVPEPVREQHDADRQVYPLGRGVKDAQLLVLTGRRQLAGIGEVGEIYVRSPHLALGYLDEVATREAFLINPFSSVPGDRLYKTGDLGRYLPDGNVEFAGRRDRQVKIRGFRVDPSEIEAVLSDHPSLAHAIVMFREDVAQQGQLVAYLVPRPGREPTTGELRRFLTGKLPEYMVPTGFVFVETFPLTPNGKIDYRALPAPARHLESGPAFVAPHTAAEKVIAGIWAEVFTVEKVGIHENFFELGGHSLLAARVTSRLAKAFHISIPLRVLFENPTVADLAVKIDELESSEIGAEMTNVLTDLESLSDEEAERLLMREGAEDI
jgi:amino acid adenylation domain-containing protein